MRYQAVTAAHIAHMLRDTQDDKSPLDTSIFRSKSVGAPNRIPAMSQPAYRDWVPTGAAGPAASELQGLPTGSARRRCCLPASPLRPLRAVLDEIERNQYDLTVDLRPLPPLASAYAWTRAVAAAIPSPRRDHPSDGTVPDSRVNPSAPGAHPCR
jgi:hypothetical protein